MKLIHINKQYHFTVPPEYQQQTQEELDQLHILAILLNHNYRVSRLTVKDTDFINIKIQSYALNFRFDLYNYKLIAVIFYEYFAPSKNIIAFNIDDKVDLYQKLIEAIIKYKEIIN